MTQLSSPPSSTTSKSVGTSTTVMKTAKTRPVLLLQLKLILYDIFIFLISLLGGMMINMFFMTINTDYLYPLPKHLNLNNPQDLQQYVQSLPIFAYFIVFMAHYGQCIVGSYIAIHLFQCTFRRTILYTITLLTMMGSIANNITILPVLPIWIWIEIPLYLVLLYYMDQKWITTVSTNSSDTSISFSNQPADEMKAKEHSE